MDFFQGQETLTTIQWILRAVIAFFFLLFAAKIMGQRSIGQLRLLDFIMAILIGNIIAHPLSDENLGLKGSMTTMSVLVILYMIGVFLSLKWVNLRNWLDPAPFPLIKNGQILHENFKKARITIDFLLSELRKGEIEDVHKVSLALWEPDGSISFFLNPQFRALTPSDMKIIPEPFSLPHTIIKEGKIDYKELTNFGKDEIWLDNKLKAAANTSIKDVLLATIDHTENVQLLLYDKK
ncbi:DUF421 domain-containing protein [Jeotgalibacillus sp. S-D1]|uniref:DUF421 domain-containing protein n=1 Tax=Jeotgalibacillus sp. S-D1 TaxID=2552189 RepID=UPI0010597881|nr:DUF421 domain-containing protein [Jeotgalibacillus sp. S-D1]TDL31914.1 DUF421 domain-containing protein [Jeotgalibacillus sp. S-D1]